MRQPYRARAFLAVSLAVVLVPAGARAQDAIERDGTLSSVLVPGGLAAARAALKEPPTADPGTLLLDLIRRSFETPVGTRGLRREATLRPLLDHLDRSQKSPASPAADELPLPLPPAVWIGAILGGRGTPETLLGELLRSPAASLMYCGLLALDPPTRHWFAANPSLLTAIAERHAAAFLLAAPGLRIESKAVQVPGGSAATPVWQALVGRPVTEPADFVRALLAAEEGRLAYFYGTAGQLADPERRLLLTLDAADPAATTAAARRMFTLFARVAAGWGIDERPFWRPALDPALLVSDLPRNADGVPRVPGTAAFWAAVFADSDPDRDRGGFADGPPVEFTWLCEQIFTGGQAVVRGPYQQLLFVARRVPTLTREVARDAVVATRAAMQFPTLVTALERARIDAIATYAAAARRAAALVAIDDARRAAITIAQFQGAIAIIARARARGSIDDRQTDVLISALAAVEPDARGDYAGGVVQWLMGAVAPVPPPRIVTSAGEESDPLERSLADDVFSMLTGPPVRPGNEVDWEGTRYRVDFAATEAARLRHFLGQAQVPYLAGAGSLVAAARVLEMQGLTRTVLSRQAELVAGAIDAISCDRQPHWTSEDLAGRCREILTALTRAARAGDVKSAARVASRLRLLADTLAARGLTELTYAIALGQPDGASILAGDAASRHEFGFNIPGFGRFGAWKRPAAGADRVRDWHVTGSMLGLEAVLAPFGLMRLSTRPPPTRPTLNDEDRRVFTETVVLMDPGPLTPADHLVMVAAIRRGRERLAALRSDRDVLSVASVLNLSSTRRSLLSWASSQGAAASRLSPYELFRLGLGPDEADRFNAWGVPGEPRLGCLCLQMPGPRQVDLFAGRWHTGVLATGFPDLNLRLAEMLAELNMPATLLPSVLAAATWDLVLNVRSRDFDDRQGLVEFVDGLTRDRVEQYLALLTADGPLMPIANGSGPQ